MIQLQKRKYEENINEEVLNKRIEKKSCFVKPKNVLNNTFQIMMTNGRHLGSNMCKFSVKDSVDVVCCYFCGIEDNIEQCVKCGSRVCYLKNGCSMLNSNDNSKLYCLDCM